MVDEPRCRIIDSSTSAENLDEDERALRALRLDLPGCANVPNGIVSLSVGKIPRREFFRTHPENRVALYMVDHVAGLDVEYHVVAPNMVQALLSIDIEPAKYMLYQILTSEGATKLIPVRQADADGSQNEWNRTKEVALIRAITTWVRIVSDRANDRYRVFEAPVGRFPDPAWPELTQAKIVRLAFTDRGRLIDNPDHPLFKKWAGRDGSAA